MAVSEIKIATLGELIDRVTPSTPDLAIGRRRDSGVYRGIGDASRPLWTSFDQFVGINPPPTKADLEIHLLRNFIRYSRPHLPTSPASDWELLVIAQHYGLPTRLLDWSYSPLVAAHFATMKSDLRSDCAIWRLDWQQVHQKFNLPELALQLEDIETMFGGDEPFTPWRLFHAEAGQYEFACLIEPPSLDARIVTQWAAFTLCSGKSQPFDSFLSQHALEGALTKFVVPTNEVARFRDQLDLAGLDERLIIPDMYGVTARMRRYYS